MSKPGFLDGRHYTTYADEVRQLKREGKLEQAEALLLRLVEATEAESKAEQWGVAPWYYEQLAIVFRKQKRQADEIAVLERYAAQRKAPGAGPAKLAARLAMLRGETDGLAESKRSGAHGRQTQGRVRQPQGVRPQPAADSPKLETESVFVAFDVETTGFDPETDEITELAGVRFNLAGEELESFQQLSRPACPIPKVVSKKTGITNEMVAGAPASWDVVQSFAAWAGESAILVAHNASFDCQFLFAAYEHNGGTPPSWRVVDTLPLARRLDLAPGAGRSLGAVLRHLGESSEGLHRAKADAYGARAVLLAAARTYKDPKRAIERRLRGFAEIAKPLATARQLDYLRDLGAVEAGLVLDGLTKREASRMIDHFQQQHRAAQAQQPVRRGGCSLVLALGLVLLGLGLAAATLSVY